MRFLKQVTGMAIVALSASAAMAQTLPNVSGTWSGNIAITMPDGAVTRDTAVLVLRQDGPALNGTVGSSIDKQSVIDNGRADAGGIRFHLSAGGGMNFLLHLDGETLSGEATAQTPRGTISARLDARPAPGLVSFRSEIVAADNALFAAYNSCNVAKFASLFAEDLEFFHDLTGLTNRQQNVEALRQRCAEKTKYRRQLDEASVQVYLIPGYGAMEFGSHSFFERGADGVEKLDAAVKFANVWKKQAGRWLLARVMSYGHY